VSIYVPGQSVAVHEISAYRQLPRPLPARCVGKSGILKIIQSDSDNNKKIGNPTELLMTQSVSALDVNPVLPASYAENDCPFVLCRRLAEMPLPKGREGRPGSRREAQGEVRICRRLGVIVSWFQSKACHVDDVTHIVFPRARFGQVQIFLFNNSNIVGFMASK